MSEELNLKLLDINNLVPNNLWHYSTKKNNVKKIFKPNSLPIFITLLIDLSIMIIDWVIPTFSFLYLIIPVTIIGVIINILININERDVEAFNNQLSELFSSYTRFYKKHKELYPYDEEYQYTDIATNPAYASSITNTFHYDYILETETSYIHDITDPLYGVW
jgi:hypothetical protein